MGSSERESPVGEVEASVIVPTRNRSRLLAATLARALGQLDVDLEVIVVDDGSDPDEARAYRDLETGRVRVCRLDQSRGPARARNAGIQASRGEWLAFLDDDDLWAPHKLRTQIDAARSSGAQWAWSGACYIDGEGALLSVQRAPSPDEVQRALPSGNVIPAGASNVIARRELIAAVGGFDERIFHLNDWDLWLRLAMSDRGAAIDEPNVAYVQHRDTHSSTRTRVFMSELALIDARSRDSGLELSDRIAREGILHWMAWGHLASGQRRLAALAWLRRAVLCRRPKDIVRAAASLGGIRGVDTVERVFRGPGRWGRHGAAPMDRPAWLDSQPPNIASPAR